MIFQLVCHAFLLITFALAAIQDQWRPVIAAQIEEKPEPK